MKHPWFLAILAVFPLVLVGCKGNSKQVSRLTGGGSSFVNKIMTEWASAYYNEKHIQIDYTSSGSGNGVLEMIDRKNDFGCTDAPMTEEQLQRARGSGGEVVHVPLAMGGVVPAYNLPETSEPLRFTGPVLADIFLGKITRWNDPRLKSLNPGVNLPAMDIAVVHRSDGSGTTFIFSDFLSRVSPEWKERVGVGTDLKWPTGVGAQKNDGVAGQIGRTPGALGYVELGFALKSNISFGSVRNRAGEFIRASLESVTRAAEGATKDIPDDLRYTLTDIPGPGAYPIGGTTWAVLYVDQPPEKGKALKEFLRWATHEGQENAPKLDYAPLSPGLIERIEKKLELIKVGRE